ncbi:zinc ribbon domain-containing protein [Secundilactobacillus muriivasis]
MEKRFCIHCGKPVPENADFCPYCGTKQPTTTSDEDVQQPKQAYDRPTEVFYPEGWQSANEETSKTTDKPASGLKKKWYKSRLVWTLIALFFLFFFIAVKTHESSYSTAAPTEYTSDSDDSDSDDTTDDDTDDDSDEDDSYDYDDDSEDDDEDDSGDFTEDSVAGISASDYDSASAASNNWSYGELLKSDSYYGSSYNVTNAQVLQATESNGSTMLLVYTDDYADELFMVYYPDTTTAVKDNYVSIKGILGNRENYDTQSGGTNTVPAMVAQDVTVTG